MRSASIALLSLALILALAGCGGGASESSSSSASSGSGSPARPAAGGGGGQPLGPDVQPDPDADPLQFLYWRIDRMYEAQDTDTDGRLYKDEYTGEAHNFERIDKNADGFLTKQEIIDDMVPLLREEGKIP